MKWKWNALFIARGAMLLGIIAVTLYSQWKQFLSAPFEMDWSTETVWLCVLVFIYIIIRRKSEINSFLYKMKVVIMIGLTSCLFFQWMHTSQLKSAPLQLIGLLLSIVICILHLMDSIWFVKGKYFIVISISCGLLSSTITLIGTVTSFYQLIILGTIFIIASLSDLVIKNYLLKGEKENE